MLQHDENWRVRAACASKDPDSFFPVGHSGPALRQVDEAKAVCARCTVVAECLAEAFSHSFPEGVWGGLRFPDEDPRLRTAPAPKVEPAQHDQWKQGGPPADAVVVERLAAGKMNRGYTMRERDLAAELMDAKGEGHQLISRRLRTSSAVVSVMFAKNSQETA